MAQDRRGGTDSQSRRPGDDPASPDEALDVLKRYAAGSISARRAAVLLGGNASEHDVYAATIKAGLRLPVPPSRVIDAEVQRAQELMARLAQRARSLSQTESE